MKIKKIFIFIALLILTAKISYAGNKDELKIASFAPIITEILYSAGLGDNVCGVTTFCDFPPEAKNKPKIGTFVEANYEYILSSGINAAVFEKGQEKQSEVLKELGIKSIEIDTSCIQCLLSSFDIVGNAFKVKNNTDKIKNNIIQGLNHYKEKLSENKKQKMLIVVFRASGNDRSVRLIAAGRKSIYNELIELLGCENALNSDTPYREISSEGIIASNPDIIIEFSHRKSSALYDEWHLYKNSVNAVKNRRVFITNNPVMARPGPRILEITDYFYNSLQKKYNAEYK